MSELHVFLGDSLLGMMTQGPCLDSSCLQQRPEVRLEQGGARQPATSCYRYFCECAPKRKFKKYGSTQSAISAVFSIEQRINKNRFFN
ncbi:MAG TPA: hypothetical protein DEF45_21095 [Rhodopirellula sp.]|nr:hypothetical protein [Rhodopirellula sp.]